jgi:glutathione synthase/RimK-type ligase-like ATP-grasp enzyme
LSGRPFLSQFVDEIRDTRHIDPNDPKYFFTEKYKILSTKEHSSFSKKVLILTRNLDREAGLIGAELWSRKIDYIRFNIEDIPDFAKIECSLSKEASDPTITVSLRGRRFNAGDISAVLLRQFEPKLASFRGNDLDREFALEQWDAGLKILYRNLDCRWINDFISVESAADRSKQFILADSLGLRIPPTLITNDPAAAREFYQSHDGEVVLKTLHHHGVEVAGRMYSMYTHEVSNRDLERLDDLTYAPCILQKKIIRRFELRVTVIGDQVFTARLGMPDENISEILYQQDIHRLLSSSALASNMICKYDSLPDSLRQQCIKLIEKLGLKYGAIDLIVDNRNEPIFLEVNPLGDWYWIESKTGLPITRAVGDLIEKLI